MNNILETIRTVGLPSESIPEPSYAEMFPEVVRALSNSSHVTSTPPTNNMGAVISIEGRQRRANGSISLDGHYFDISAQPSQAAEAVNNQSSTLEEIEIPTTPIAGTISTFNSHAVPSVFSSLHVREYIDYNSNSESTRESISEIIIPTSGSLEVRLLDIIREPESPTTQREETSISEPEQQATLNQVVGFLDTGNTDESDDTGNNDELFLLHTHINRSSSSGNNN